MRISALVAFNALHRGDKAAFRDESGELTFKELHARVASLSAWFRERFEPGERVAVLAESSRHYPELLLAALESEIVFVPLSPKLSIEELEVIASVVTPSAILTDAGLASRGAALCSKAGVSHYSRDPREVVPTLVGHHREVVGSASTGMRTGEEQAAVIFLSSGTTGAPKGIVHSEGRMLAGALLAGVTGDVRPTDEALQVLPLAGVNLQWMLAYFARGATLTILKNFDAAAVHEAIARHQVTHMVVAPIMLHLLVESSRDSPEVNVGSLRWVGYGGSRSNPSHVQAATSLYGPVLTHLYGQSEIAGLIAAKGPAAHQSHPEATGFPAMGVELLVVDSAGNALGPDELGEVALRCPYVSLGYWADLVDGGRVRTPHDLHRTGDSGFIDQTGALRVVGRTDDMLITGANNVFPAEVENVIAACPGVADVAVVGLEDPNWGQVVTAVIVPASVAAEDLVIEAEAACRQQLASYKVPRIWHVVDGLPRNPTGKVIKAAIPDAISAHTMRRLK